MPPAPVQVSVNFCVALIAAVFCVPLNASEPLQAPEAVQEVALLEDQLNVEMPPLATVFGLALSDTVGEDGVTGPSGVELAGADELPPPQAVSIKNPESARHAATYREPRDGGPPSCLPLFCRPLFRRAPAHSVNAKVSGLRLSIANTYPFLQFARSYITRAQVVIIAKECSVAIANLATCRHSVTSVDA